MNFYCNRKIENISGGQRIIIINNNNIENKFEK